MGSGQGRAPEASLHIWTTSGQMWILPPGGGRQEGPGSLSWAPSVPCEGDQQEQQLQCEDFQFPQSQGGQRVAESWQAAGSSGTPFVAPCVEGV